MVPVFSVAWGGSINHDTFSACKAGLLEQSSLVVSFFVSRSLDVQLFIHLSQNDKYSQHKILISKIIKLYFLNDRYDERSIILVLFYFKKNPKSKQNVWLADVRFFCKIVFIICALLFVRCPKLANEIP